MIQSSFASEDTFRTPAARKAKWREGILIHTKNIWKYTSTGDTSRYSYEPPRRPGSASILRTVKNRNDLDIVIVEHVHDDIGAADNNKFTGPRDNTHAAAFGKDGKAGDGVADATDNRRRGSWVGLGDVGVDTGEIGKREVRVSQSHAPS